MIRIILRLAIVMFIGCSALLFFFHARPSAALGDTVLKSPGCERASACFMGIRPGVTTIPQAFALLQQHPWVDYVYTQQYTQITWTWSRAPARLYRRQLPRYDHPARLQFSLIGPELAFHSVKSGFILARLPVATSRGRRTDCCTASITANKSCWRSTSPAAPPSRWVSGQLLLPSSLAMLMLCSTSAIAPSPPGIGRATDTTP